MIRLALALLFVPAALQAEVVDFESTEPGTMPPDWTTPMTHEGGSPRWMIERDPAAPAGPNVLAQRSVDPTSPGRFPLAIYDALELTNGELRVKLKPISGRIDRSGGLVWRYRSLDESGQRDLLR